MKRILLMSIVLFINSFSIIAQNNLDKSLLEISNDLSDKIKSKEIKKLVVLYITDINKLQTVPGKYMADVISVNIVNNPNNFMVFDRENLSGIAEAKKMIAEGYIDAEKAKTLGRILAVDAIIVGNYTVLSSSVKLTLKVLDVNSGFVIAAAMKDIQLSPDLASLLGVNYGNNENSLSNKGFNSRPLNSNENFNNPETVDKECQTKNTGDFCFSNATNMNLKIYLKPSASRTDMAFETIILKKGETQCSYNLKAKNYGYSVYNNDSNSYNAYSNGQFLVEKCKSKTLTIK